MRLAANPDSEQYFSTPYAPLMMDVTVFNPTLDVWLVSILTIVPVVLLAALWWMGRSRAVVARSGTQRTLNCKVCTSVIVTELAYVQHCHMCGSRLDQPSTRSRSRTGRPTATPPTTPLSKSNGTNKPRRMPKRQVA